MSFDWSAFSQKDVEIKENFSLSRVSSIGCGGKARIAIFPKQIDDFVFVLRKLDEADVPYYVQGKMSNTLALDGEIDKVVVLTTKLTSKRVNGGSAYAECGVTLSGLIFEMARSGYGGHEGLAHIPGTVGGALCGNAGAYGDSISDAFVSGLFYDSESEGTVELNKSDMGFSYRNSVLKYGRLIFLSGLFTFSPFPIDDILAVISANKKKRAESQPLRDRTLGCVFKQFDGVGAGYYIDRAGLKGLRVGGAKVSEKHAGFIVNDSKASSSDVLELIDFIKKRVYDKFGINLEEEIRFLF